MPKKRTMIYSNVKQNKKRAEEISRIKDDQINLDDEIFIGLENDFLSSDAKDKKEADNKSDKKKRKKANKNDNKKAKGNVSSGPIKKSKKEINTQNVKKKKAVQKKIKKDIEEPDDDFLFDRNNNSSNNTQSKGKKRKLSKIKVGIFLFIILGGIIAFLCSPVFSIKQIDISINKKQILTEEQISGLSDINVGENIFATSKRHIRNEIEKNPYVQSAKVTRKLPGKVVIEVTERHIKFQLENEGKYVNIDDQGYILDESEDRKDVALITGYTSEDFTSGSRMNEGDLKKLSDVIQILQEANNNEIDTIITKIDIEDKNDYILYFENEGKIAYIGDVSSINDKLAYVKKILEMESDYEGEIFVNVDLSNGEYPYFREKV